MLLVSLPFSPADHPLLQPPQSQLPVPLSLLSSLHTYDYSRHRCITLFFINCTLNLSFPPFASTPDTLITQSLHSTHILFVFKQSLHENLHFPSTSLTSTCFCIEVFPSPFSEFIILLYILQLFKHHYRHPNPDHTFANYQVIIRLNNPAARNTFTTITLALTRVVLRMLPINLLYINSPLILRIHVFLCISVSLT